MKCMKVLGLMGVVIFLWSCSARSDNHEADRISSQVDSLLKEMTLEEKIGQLTLYTSDYDVTGPTIREHYKEDIRNGRVGAIFNAFGAEYTRELQEIAMKETRLRIPLLFGYDVIHGYKTVFPIPLGEAASWDTEAVYRSARIAATEAAAEGLHWTFAPMCDVSRDPRWGRVAEGSGEDTYLGSRMAEARVKGFQGKGLGEVDAVMACVKHFAAYGAVQAGRDYHTVDMSDRMLREVYLPPYKAGIDAGAATVMTSFNEYDGVPASGSKFLMTEVLRHEWDFTGFVVTDYTSIMEMIPHGAAEDTAAAAALSIEAGVDMDMQAGFYQTALPMLVKEGKIKEEVIDDAVKRVLRKKFELGLFKDPYRFSNVEREKKTIMRQEHLDAARDVARKSFVLLKNARETLPLQKSAKIALIGPLANAKREMIGSWSAAGDGAKAISVLQGIQAMIPSARVSYARGCNINDDSTQYFAEALRLAKQAEVVVMALGESAMMSGEAASRASLGLPGVQQKLFDEIKKTGKRVVVILFNGRPLTIQDLDKNADAILDVWFPGTQAGYAIADVLFGDFSPSGKLPMTFPRSVGQIPIFYNMKNTGRPMDPKNKYTSKYLDESNDPLYPFGYGLSYTNFNYGAIRLSDNEMTEQDSITVRCTVSNESTRDSEEVVQLYIRDWTGSVTRPVKELKGFKKIMLKGKESKEIVFVLSSKDLSFYRRDMTWGTEPGKFDVYVGTNSRDAQQATFVLK
jgi:beta-glucosidase